MKIYNPTIEGEIKLSAFSNTRNDGVIPTNKVLSTDTNGNLKLYSIATAPAPYLDYVVPDSTLPSTTGNFQLHGSFFTPSMCLTANLATSIIFTGQTVNYAIFHSSNWIEVNITTGATEGSFAITLNNGLSATFSNAIMIVLGTVYTPVFADWTSITGGLNITEGNNSYIQSFGVYTTANYIPQIDYTKNFSIRFKHKASPLGNIPANYDDKSIELWTIDGLTKVFHAGITHHLASDSYYTYAGTIGVAGNNPPNYTNPIDIIKNLVEFRYINNFVKVFINGVEKYSVSYTLTQNLQLRLIQDKIDIVEIKIIELAA